jgi:hypothetical protein
MRLLSYITLFNALIISGYFYQVYAALFVTLFPERLSVLKLEGHPPEVSVLKLWAISFIPPLH